MRPENERLDHIGIVSVVTNVPIIVVCNYYGEVFGFNNQLNDFITELCTFYKVTEVKNVKSKGDVYVLQSQMGPVHIL
jgi:exopolysaccharide biosynthesis predicted pyruvyltransferase EpsI